MIETRANGRLAALVFGAALFVAVLAWWMSLAPRPLPADAPLEEFSAYRAMKYIQDTAVEPHSGGSHANEKVFEYIVRTLREMEVERPIERHGRGVHRSTAT